MDLQKEREAFEKHIQTVAHPHRSPKVMFFTVNDGHGNIIYADSVIQDRWITWQAAIKHVVPDGFVLVPRELSADEARKHAEAMFNKVERMARNEQRDLSESEFELFKNRWIDARTLTIQFDWKAMIEARGQAND